MNKAIIFSSFIIWIFYFNLLYLDVIDNHNIKTFKELIKSNKKTLSIIKFFLFILFIYFISFNNTLISELSFSSIFIFLLSDYININNKAIDFNYIFKNKKYLVILIIIILIPLIFYLITKNLEITYLIMFIFTFFIYYLVDSIKILFKSKK